MSTGTTNGQAISLSAPIPDELREQAAMAGLQDIETSWLGFTGHLNGQVPPASLSGEWQKWFARDLRKERAARDRRSNGTKVADPPPYHAAWKPPADSEPAATGEQAATYAAELKTKITSLRAAKAPPTEPEAKKAQ